LLPLSGQGSTTNFGIEGRARSTTFIEQYNARPQCATPDYFRTMGVPLLKGRYFTDADTRDAQLVTIINQTLARKYFPDEEPLGKKIFAWGDRPREIIGLVGDVKHDNLTGAAYPEIYFPYAQEPSAASNIVVRTTADPTALVGAIKAELKALDAEIPMAAVRTMEELSSATAARPRLLAALMAVFAGIAATLAAVGIFGVMSYAVEQRTREIGIRMALGAERGDVSRLIVRQGMILASVGVAVGLAGGFAASRLLEKLLFGVTPGDPLTFAGVAVGLLAVSFAANYVPARRATRVDPTEALRYE
jgi:putative ABC transport system permease protein